MLPTHTLIMSEIVDESLEKITKGAGLILLGTAAGMLLAFATRILIVRYITQGEYGIYSLAFVLLSISVVISVLGLHTGTARQLAFYRGKDDMPKVKGVLLSSLQISTIASLLLSLVLFFTSDFVATRFFHSPELSTPLKIFCLAIPFFVLIYILTSIFRGFDMAQPRVYFQDLLRNVLFPLLVIIVILLDLSLMGVVYAFVVATALTFIAFAVYATRKLPLTLRDIGSVSASPVRRELLLFSLPLFAVAMLDHIATWTDTLMIGYFMTPDDVGLYNVALPLVHLLLIALTAARFLYMPLMSQSYAKNQEEEIKRSYAVLTKWIFAATLPVFFILVLFPEVTLNILFGSRYIGAAFALQILSAGFFVSVLLGLSGTTLIAMGKTRFLMWGTLIATIANIILNMVLIPPLGIVGAAIATASALAGRNLFWVARLYLFSGIHPFTKNYLKPAIASTILGIVIYTLVRNLDSVIPWWLLALLLVSFFGAYLLSLLLTRSFDKEDISMLLAIERRAGINLSFIKRTLRRLL